jgi:hypothetical protein
MVANDNIFREADEAVTADDRGKLSVTVGEYVIDAVRFSCVSAGGTVFTSVGLEVIVPVKAILAFDLDLSQVDTSRCSTRVQTGRVEKWQLSSEEHARILQLLSETLGDQVAAAVKNVSGRS